MKKLMMVMSVALLALGASAATEDVDGVTWSYEVSNGEASVYKGGSMTPAISASTAGAIAIPATLGGYPVTSIGSDAFRGCSRLTSVTIPEGVTSIRNRAFVDCNGLTSVDIPASVTSISDDAFCSCSALDRIAVASRNTAYCSRDGILFDKAQTKLICCPGSKKGTVTIPSSVTSIGYRAFFGCSGLTSVTIPEGVTSIGEYVFYGCSGLTSVTIPSSVTSIGDSAFRYCSGLTSVTILEGVTSIGYRAFFECSGLTSVTIPSSVTSIGGSAFCNCSGLTRVDITDLKEWFGISFGDSSALGHPHCLYLNGEEIKDLIIPEGVTNIGSSAFSGCSGLTSVTIPEGVTSIGEYVFSGCSGLTSVTIPEGVTSVGERAFYNCSGLTSVTIPSSVTSIGSYAFESCRGLTSVEFLGPPPDNVRNSYLLSSRVLILPREYGAQWRVVCDSYFGGIYFFAGYGQGEKPVVEIVSAEIRENDPTVMDVVYKVKSPKPTVKVRALAFQDGERSFAKVVRPTEFIEDTAKNIGDAITANEEHKLSWRVSADWKVDLAKVKFEVLAREGDLLPLELTTIPKVGDHAAMEISWNAVREQQVFDALLWMYADGDEGLTIANGVLKNGTTQLANGTSLSTTAAARYVFSKMGFSLLSGDELKYANEMTRLGLSPSGVRQYAWREVND